MGVSCGLWDLRCILQDLSLQCLRSVVVACGLSCPISCGILGFSGDSVVKNSPRMQETWVWSLGWEDHLEKEMATHSSILAWEILWTEETGGLQSMGLQRVGQDWATKQQTSNNKMWDLSSLTKNRTCVSCIARWFLTTREVPEKNFLRHYLFLKCIIINNTLFIWCNTYYLFYV